MVREQLTKAIKIKGRFNLALYSYIENAKYIEDNDIKINT